MSVDPATGGIEAHGAVVREALEAGKHALVEKPFVETLGEARDLTRLARERGLVLAVAQNYRFGRSGSVRRAATSVSPGS